MVQPITNVLPRTVGLFYFFGMCVPFIQVAFGIGLLTRRFRRVSLILAVAMHVFILAMLGPAGYDWNNIVWPWTAAMAVFDLLLFSSRADFSLRDVLGTKGHFHHAVALALFALLPFLSFFNLWDSYLSSALYSGNLTEAQIYASDAGRKALPQTIQRYLVHTSPDTNVLNLQRWAIEDLNVSPYPETRVFKQIAKSVCNRLADRSQLVLNVREQRMFFSRPETVYRCRDL
jgi:TRAP-type C4-dicarboxylate transport system permease small subunit